MPGRGVPNPMVVLLCFVALGLAVSALALLVAWPSMRSWYGAVRHPPGALPPRVLVACWGSLPVLAGIAAWRVWRSSRRPPRHRALLLWGWQRLFEGLWCVCLFGSHRLQTATALVLFSLLLAALALRDFRSVDRPACVLMTPSLFWVCYATWLTAGIAWLNPG